MIKVLFICHGNICRSPMAEFVMKDMVNRRGMAEQFEIASCATTTEEIGNDMYPPAKKKLSEMGIPFTPRHARKLTPDDAEAYDYIIGMDGENLYDMTRILKGVDGVTEKIYLLMDFSGERRDVADPWYTRDFTATYEDVVSGCEGLLAWLTEK